MRAEFGDFKGSELLNEANCEEWDDFVDSKEDVYPYHKSSFIFSNLTLNMSANASFLLWNHDGKIAGVFPLNVKSQNLKNLQIKN